jgi:hypothetical protein
MCSALLQHIREQGLDPGAMREMEACCGTGRFHTFLKVRHKHLGCWCVRARAWEFRCSCRAQGLGLMHSAPLSQHIREQGLDPTAIRVMEACCGKGRFHTVLTVCS